MAPDYEKRQQGREYDFKDNMTNEQLIETIENAEQKICTRQEQIRCLEGSIQTEQHEILRQQGRITLHRGILQNRLAEAKKKNDRSQNANNDSEQLFLSDDVSKSEGVVGKSSKETAPAAPKTIGSSTTPQQSTETPFGQTGSSSIVPCSSNPDSTLRVDPVKIRNNKLVNELVDGHTLEQLRLWLNYTGWSDQVYRHTVLELLERQSALDPTSAEFRSKAEKLAAMKRPDNHGNRPGNLASRNAPVEAVSCSTLNNSKPTSTVSKINDTGVNQNRQSNHIRRSEFTRRSNWDSRYHSAPHPPSRREWHHQLRRSRSPSPSYARSQRSRRSPSRDPVDSRRGSLPPRRRRGPASPPPLRNQRFGDRHYSPPPRHGSIGAVGATGGWGQKGGYDYGHGWQ